MTTVYRPNPESEFNISAPSHFFLFHSTLFPALTLTCWCAVLFIQAVNVMPQTGHLPRLLCSLGMSLHDAPVPADMKSCYTVILDGRVIGRVDMDIAPSLVNRLRLMKVLGLEKVLIKLISLEIRT